MKEQTSVQVKQNSYERWRLKNKQSKPGPSKLYPKHVSKTKHSETGELRWVEEKLSRVTATKKVLEIKEKAVRGL